jgi:hypothetical protein
MNVFLNKKAKNNNNNIYLVVTVALFKVQATHPLSGIP